MKTCPYFRQTVFDSTEPVCWRSTITNCATHTLSSREDYILFLKSVFLISDEDIRAMEKVRCSIGSTPTTSIIEDFKKAIDE